MPAGSDLVVSIIYFSIETYARGKAVRLDQLESVRKSSIVIGGWTNTPPR